MQGCSGRAAAFIHLFRIRARFCLIVILNRQDTVTDEKALKTHQLDSPAGVVANGLVMRGLAANNAAQRDIAIEVTLTVCHGNGGGNFKRTGHLDHFTDTADGFDLSLGSRDQIVSNCAIERRHYNHQFHRFVESRCRQDAVFVLLSHDQSSLRIERVPTIDRPNASSPRYTVSGASVSSTSS